MIATGLPPAFARWTVEGAFRLASSMMAMTNNTPRRRLRLTGLTIKDTEDISFTFTHPVNRNIQTCSVPPDSWSGDAADQPGKQLMPGADSTSIWAKLAGCEVRGRTERS